MAFKDFVWVRWSGPVRKLYIAGSSVVFVQVVKMIFGSFVSFVLAETREELRSNMARSRLSVKRL